MVVHKILVKAVSGNLTHKFIFKKKDTLQYPFMLPLGFKDPLKIGMEFI